MILTVLHTTIYRYGAPVRGVVQSHRLTPSIFDGQRTRSWTITVEGGLAGGGFRDGAGDWVQGCSVRGPVTEVAVQVEGVVETQDLAGLLRGHRELVPPDCYLSETAVTRADAALTELAHSAVAGTSDPLDRDATTATTTAAEALALGKGVCQDHAHALIAAARVQDIPARYISGYLMAEGGAVSNEAAHAWAELWVKGLGWVGFDPANRCCPDARFIRLGSGYDASDAAPIRGTARGPGAESLDVTVAIQAVQQ